MWEGWRCLGRSEVCGRGGDVLEGMRCGGRGGGGTASSIPGQIAVYARDNGTQHYAFTLGLVCVCVCVRVCVCVCVCV